MEGLEYQLIIKFLEGELNAEEKSKFKDWQNATPRNEKRFQEVKFLWEKSNLTKPFQKEISIDVDAALANVHRQLPQTQPAKVVNLRRRFIQISAAAAVILFAGLFWMLNSSVEMIEIKTLANEQKKVILPDESIVWLNENSQLTYPKNFEENKRAVAMNGDLVFEVTPNKQKPFIVKSEELAVQVLGTKFNVISPNNKNTNSFVHVLHGKVSVQRDDFSGNKVILEKGMSAVLDKKDALSLTNEFSANRLFWMNKTLVFDQTRLEDVVADLENIFKTKLEVENLNVLNCEFTGTFDDSITIEKLLEIMTAIFGIEIEKINSTHFKIKKGTC
ncbi:MAG: FecR family protein [Saprospiraceae bacterium]